MLGRVTRRKSLQIIISVGCNIILLVYLFWRYDFWTLIDRFWIPWYCYSIWFGVMIITQHTGVKGTYFRAEGWTWEHGVLSTYDRNYGWLMNWLMHYNNLHLTHHLFPKIPHYHLPEATAAIKKVLGTYYLSDGRWFWEFVCESIYDCVIEDESESVITYPKGNGKRAMDALRR